MPVDSSPASAAIAHVHDLSKGGPLDRNHRVTLHFHPDLPFESGLTLASIARQGTYVTQFETRTSNGGLTAHHGGDRWRWESRTLDRTTFCFPDSVFEPSLFGTAEAMSLVDAAGATEFADPLDHYIEAHVHGVVDIGTDVEALVLDPSYRGTQVEEIAHSLTCPVLWHYGYAVDADEVAEHPDYRGATIVDLAREVALDGRLTPAILGLARRGSYDPQDVKKVWHYIARFGGRA
ncbi:DUF3626 domain-containing protein [Rhodococcus sp. NPDC055024]